MARPSHAVAVALFAMVFSACHYQRCRTNSRTSTSLFPDLFGGRDGAEAAPDPRPAPPRMARVDAPARPTLRSRLRTEKLSGIKFDADEGDYLSVIRRIQTIASIPIITTPEARRVFDEEALVLELDLVAPLSVANLLDLMMDRSESLRWSVQNHVVMVETLDQSAESLLSLQYYDVRSFVFPRTEFIAPKISGIPTGEEEGQRSGSEGEEVIHTITPDQLVETVRMATDPKYWDGDAGASIELTESGTMIVRASKEKHAEIRRFLGV